MPPIRWTDWRCGCGTWNGDKRKSCRKCARVSLPLGRYSRARLRELNAERKTDEILKRFGL